MREGRWDDVLGECRKTINALYVGIDEWGNGLQLTQAEKDAIQSASNSSDKIKAKRNLFFIKLVQHDEKGLRLNNLRASLYNYLSLDPHEPDHKGVHFTREDAAFSLRMTTGFCANMLKRLHYHLNKGIQV
ncbi:MAG: hypothetical protein ACREAY_01015 [Nitrososphaera sp.]|uniref:hypothetical protein n=1 Tax=Nitrososphaera sp. TaxID=1971748 RepID=UPI003D6DEB03